MRQTLLSLLLLLTAATGFGIPRPEYPRPQFERTDWLNLNGTWSYEFDFAESGMERDLFKSEGFKDPIIVPFCPESPLSGVNHKDFINQMWYHRNITVPKAWDGRHILLHFGGIDYQANIYIDGRHVFEHHGGSASFAVDITDYVKPGVESDLVIRVKDDVRSELQTGDKGFWAPQIYKNGDKYLFFYTANEQTAVAEADTVTGPYTQTEIRPIDGSEKNIDPYLFKDEDGKYYLYHVRFDRGNYLWAAEYDIDGDSIDKATLTQCFKVTDRWEDTDEPNQWDPIMEGPTVFKKDGTYYLMYSANHFLNPDYAVGYASAPSPLGPWTKHKNNPIIHVSKVGENGSGHGDLFTGLDGNPYYVYHIHHNDSTVSPRHTRIVPLDITTDSAGILDITVKADGIIIPRMK